MIKVSYRQRQPRQPGNQRGYSVATINPPCKSTFNSWKDAWEFVLQRIMKRFHCYFWPLNEVRDRKRLYGGSSCKHSMSRVWVIKTFLMLNVVNENGRESLAIARKFSWGQSTEVSISLSMAICETWERDIPDKSVRTYFPVDN